MLELSVVVPCFNEKDNLPSLTGRFAEVLEGRKEEAEVILVDNGSTDGSGELLEELLPSCPFMRVVRVEINRGYGYGILQGLAAARGRYIGWTHADLQTDPGDIIKAWDLLEGSEAPCYVKGNRVGRPWTDTVFTVGMGIFESVYLGCRLQDINAQPNFFPREFFRSWRNPPEDFSLDLYALYMAGKQGLEVRRFPVEFPQRIHGASHWNTGASAKWKFIKRTISFSVRLKKGGIS